MPEPARIRIRWGWFAACIVLGAAGIAAGLLIAPAADQPSYIAGVLGGVGTTLLLVGIVVLLERRIVDTAVRAVRRARAEGDRELRQQIQELEDRMTELWAGATSPEDIAKRREAAKRLTEEFTDRVIEDAKEQES